MFTKNLLQELPYTVCYIHLYVSGTVTIDIYLVSRYIYILTLFMPGLGLSQYFSSRRSMRIAQSAPAENADSGHFSSLQS